MASPKAKGKGAPKAHRGSQKPPMNVMAPVSTGKAEVRIRNKNAGFGGVFRDRENKPKRGGGDSFGGG